MKLLTLTLFVLMQSHYHLAQKPIANTVMCTRQGGQCKDTCGNPIDNIPCPGGQVCCKSKEPNKRQACISSENKKCKKRQGTCKISCLDSETIIKQGCKSTGCICCAPKLCARNLCASGMGKCVPKKKDCLGTIVKGKECSTTGKRCYCCLPGTTTLVPSTTVPVATDQPTTRDPSPIP